MMAPLLGAIAVFLALILLGSAAHKAADLRRASAAAAGLVGLSRPLTALAVIALLAETALGPALLVAQTRHSAALGAVVLWAAYAMLVYRLAATGREGFDCGCSFSRRTSSSSKQWQVAATLAVLAMFVALFPAVPVVTAITILGGLSFVALYVCIAEVMASGQIQREAQKLREAL